MKVCINITKKNSIFAFCTLLLILIITTVFFCILKNQYNNINNDIIINEEDKIENEEFSESQKYIASIKERYKDEKIVALTFDDGPSKYTDKLLDILDEENVKATFFVLGYKAEKKGEIVQRAAQDGNDIGIHGYSHKLFTKLKEKDLRYEIETSKDIVEPLINDKVSLIRVPYGEVNKNVKRVIQEYKLKSVLWNLDSNDWQSKNKNKVINKVIKNIKDKSVILMHDSFASTVEAMPTIIDNLKDNGYEFVTMTEYNILNGTITVDDLEKSLIYNSK